MSAQSGSSNSLTIATGKALRLLKYVADVNSAGYRPTVAEFDAYAQAPDQIGASFFAPEIVNFGKLVAGFLNSGQGRQVPGETQREYLTRVHWLLDDDGALSVTALGSAVLRSQTQALAGDAPVLVLEAGDSFAYAEVTVRLSNVGQATLVDPWLRVEQLLHVAQFTEVIRILVGQGVNQNQLKAAVGSLNLPRPFEVRVSPEVHDRYFVPKVGTVDVLGTSLNGVGKRPTILTPLDVAGSNAVRRLVDGMWKKASPLAVAQIVQRAEP